MSEVSFPYAVSRVKANESSFIDTNLWARLYDASREEFLKLLRDYGYGAKAKNQEDVNDLTLASLTSAREFIKEISPEEEITNLFLYQVDGHNIKAILKGLIERVEVDDILLAGGTISIEELEKAFSDDSFSSFPLRLRQAVEDFDPENPPDIISSKIDDAVYNQIKLETDKRRTNKLVKDYFLLKIDLTNILSTLRAKKLGWEFNKLAKMLISGGAISFESFEQALSAEPEEIIPLLSTGEYKEKIAAALEKYFKHHEIYKLELDFDQITFEIFHDDYTNSFSLSPIINYLLVKEKEARLLRLLYVSKQTNLEITLRELGIE